MASLSAFRHIQVWECVPEGLSLSIYVDSGERCFFSFLRNLFEIFSWGFPALYDIQQGKALFQIFIKKEPPFQRMTVLFRLMRENPLTGVRCNRITMKNFKEMQFQSPDGCELQL